MKPAHGPRSGATFSPRPLREVPDLPIDNMAAASHLSVHVVHARELQRDLAVFSAAFQVGVEAQCASMAEIQNSLQARRAPEAVAFQESLRSHRATMEAAQAVQRKIDIWVESWTGGN